MAERERGVDRRTVLQGVGAGLVVNGLGVSVSAATDSRPVSSDGAPDDPVDGDGVPSEVVVEVNDEQYGVPIKRVRIHGTCEDLDQFIAAGGMDDPEGMFHDFTGEDTAGGGTEAGTGGSGSESESGGGDGDSPVPSRSQCEAKQEYEREEKQRTGGGDGDVDDSGNAISSTLPNWTVYGHAEHAGGRKYDPEIGGERYLHQREAPWSAEQDGKTTFSETRTIEDRATVTRERLGEGKKRLTLESLDVSIQAEPEIRIPDWHPTHSVSEECRREWCTWIQKILEHELEHARDVLAVSQRVTEHLQDPKRWLEFDQRDSAMTPPGDGQKLSRTVSDERVFWKELQVWVSDYLKWAECLQWKRAKEMHNSNEWGIAPLDCSKCRSCEEADPPPVTDFETWNLEVLYTYNAQIEYEQGGYHRIDQWYKASFELESAGIPGANGGSPVPGIVQDVLRPIVMLINFIAGIFNFVFGGGNGSSSDDPVQGSGTKTFLGGGQAAWGHDERKFLQSSDSWSDTRTEGVGQKTFDGSRRKASLEFDPGEDEYSVKWPGFNDEAVSHHADSRGFTKSQEATVSIASGVVGMAQGDETPGPGGDPSSVGGDGDAPSGPDDSQGAPPGVGAVVGGERPTYPVEDCGTVLSGRVEQPLYVGTQPHPDRTYLSPNGDGDPVGTEQVFWVLVPAERDDGSGPGHLGCPSDESSG